MDITKREDAGTRIFAWHQRERCDGSALWKECTINERHIIINKGKYEKDNDEKHNDEKDNDEKDNDEKDNDEKDNDEDRIDEDRIDEEMKFHNNEDEKQRWFWNV